MNGLIVAIAMVPPVIGLGNPCRLRFPPLGSKRIACRSSVPQRMRRHNRVADVAARRCSDAASRRVEGLDRDAAIAALPLRLIHRAVGALIDARRSVAGAKLREPYGERNLHRLAMMAER